MKITYKKIFSFILLVSYISWSQAFVSNDNMDNDVAKQIESIEEQLDLIKNKLTLSSTSNSEAETLRQLEESLITEKARLIDGVELYKKIEKKVVILCEPPSIFKIKTKGTE